MHDIQSESGVLATLITNPDFILHSESLTASHFAKKENGAIYWAIHELYEKGIDKIDEFNMTTQINSNKGVKKIIDDQRSDFLKELFDNALYVARNTKEEYLELASRVTQLSFKRDTHRLLSQFQNMCLDDSVDLNQLNLAIMNDVDKLATQYVTQDRIPMYTKQVHNIWQNIQDKRNEDGTFGIPSKHAILEDYFTYQSGELVIVAARRKHGKSMFGLNELVHLLKQGLSCVILDTEMNDEIFTIRLLAHLTGVEVYRLQSGNYSPSEEQIINNSIEWLSKQSFTHIYDPQWTRDKVYTTAKILKNKLDFDILIYDYIKITDNSTISSSEQYNELGNWCNFLKNNIAGGLDVPVLSFVQLNRNNDIADSDKIERYASTGLKWIKKTQEEIVKDGVECGNYKLNVMFNRLGLDHDSDEYIDFVFNNKTLDISVAKKQHEADVPDYIKC